MLSRMRTNKEAYDFLQWLVKNEQCTVEQGFDESGMVLSLGYPKKLPEDKEDQVLTAFLLAAPEYVRLEKERRDAGAKMAKGSFEAALKRRFRS